MMQSVVYGEDPKVYDNTDYTIEGFVLVTMHRLRNSSRHF